MVLIYTYDDLFGIGAIVICEVFVLLSLLKG